MTRRALRHTRALVPGVVEERMRVALARQLERRARSRRAVRGAALVLHDVAPRAGDPATEIEPAFEAARLHRLVGHLGASYRLVRASELLPAARERRPGEQIPIALTFDDDLRSHLEHAAPVVAEHGAVATAFLCGAERPFWWQRLQAAVDGGRLTPGDLPGIDAQFVVDALARRPRAIGRLAFAIEQLEPRRRAALAAGLDERGGGAPVPLDTEGARGLRDAGWEIGFHSRDHDAMPALDDDALGRALVEGRERLGEPSPRSFAYPHGKAGPREAAAARASGYAAAFTGAAEIVTERTDAHLVGRLQPDRSSVGRFVLRLARALMVD
ncbi:MAG: hypothetical protein QOK21_2821 [Solirubrobacteraceae bacterium]|jgi:peptidoglycan/xylan/chitin deacetylase (PgdA/CDA1 family)|nr:hypothetical protein [Solirubrobacteraceae bacterium]